MVNIENYKSFHKTENILLSRGYNIIVGQNNAGKSSLLNLLSLKFSSEPHKSLETKPELNTRFKNQSKLNCELLCTKEELINFMKNRRTTCLFPRPIKITDFNEIKQKVEDYLNNATTFKFSCFTHGSNVFISNILNLPFKVETNICYQLKIENSKFSLSQNGFQGQQSTFGKDIVEDYQRNVYIFHSERYKVGTSKNGTNIILNGNSENLPEVLDNLKSNPIRFEKYNNLVREIFPEIHRVTTVNRANNVVEIMIWTIDPNTERDDLAISLDKSGTGIGQVLSILYVIMTSSNPRTIIIDEPQSFLHPGAIRKLFRILDRFQQHQYIMATHSTTVINSAMDSSIIFVEKNDNKSQLVLLKKYDSNEIKMLLKKLGVNISDIFGADNILWVEGPTEEEIFPKLISDKLSSGTQICAVKNTGDFDGKRAKLVFEIYQKVSGGNRLIPPSIGFIFDSEYKTDKEKDDIRRMSKVKVNFLKRIMIENYLLNVNSIKENLNQIKEEYEISTRDEITTQSINNWILDNFKKKKYYPNISEETINCLKYEDDFWLYIIHGANFLTELYDYYFGEKYTFQKTKDSINIAFWIIENESNFLFNLNEELNEYINQ